MRTRGPDAARVMISLPRSADSRTSTLYMESLERDGELQRRRCAATISMVRDT